MTDIFLSLALLARDPEGATTLERALRSALERPDGPMFDEVVVLFGGDPHTACAEIVARLAREFPSVAWSTHDLPPEFPRTEDGGLADFAAARNLLYAKCRGAWIAYIDADDIIPSADAASETEVRRAPVASPPSSSSPPASVTLKSFLKSLPPGFNSLTFRYHYGHDHIGNVVTATFREWVRWRDGFSWVNRAPGHHEALFPVYPNVRRVASLTGFYVEHRPPDDVNDRRVRRNDALLAANKHMTYADKWAARYYMARQAERLGQFVEAADLANQCIPIATSEDEKYLSLHTASRVKRQIGRWLESKMDALLAYDIDPTRGEAIADILLCELADENPTRAASWYEALLACPRNVSRVGSETNAYEIDLWPHISASRALLALERFDDAVAAAERAMKFAPYDPGAQAALKDAKGARDLRRARDAARFLLEYAGRRDDARRAERLFESLPYVLENDKELHATLSKLRGAASEARGVSVTADRLRAVTTAPEGFLTTIVPYGTTTDAEPRCRVVYTPERLYDEIRDRDAAVIERLERVPPDDTDPNRQGVIVATYSASSIRSRGPKVVIFCPEHAERWGPFMAERTGLSGSEEMIAEQIVLVARFLAREGAEVTVYAPVDDLIVDRNVVWRPFETFDPLAPCDVLISHRTGHLTRRPRIGARKHFVWLHDPLITRSAEDFETERRAKVTKYLTLSRWQEEGEAATHGVAPAQMLRVENTPDPDDALPADEATRKPHRAVYASAPYRGLGLILACWEKVRERVHDAELMICNEWQVDSRLIQFYPEIVKLEQTIALHQKTPGIIWHGRSTTSQIREHFQSASILLHPATLPESSCRTAIRAMANGCVPVYRPLASLEETMGGWGVQVPGEVGGPEYLKALEDAIVREMLSPTRTFAAGADVATSAEYRRLMSEEVTARHDPWAHWREVAGLVKVRAPQEARA